MDSSVSVLTELLDAVRGRDEEALQKALRCLPTRNPVDCSLTIAVEPPQLAGALHLAVSEGNAGALQELLSLSHASDITYRYVRRNAFGFPSGLVHLAADWRKFEPSVMRLLMEHAGMIVGSIESTETVTAIGRCMSNHSWEGFTALGHCVVSAFADSGDVVTPSGAAERIEAAVRLMLRSGASINDGAVPLKGATSKLAKLLAVGSPSPLHLAVLAGLPKVAEVLVDHGADVNGRDLLGRTPLHYAAKFNVTNSIDVLLENGADYTILDTKNQTALMLAVFGGSGLAANALNRRCGGDAPEKMVWSHRVRHSQYT